ncbi:MAG TPA: prepilin peptidase [Candidatus Paceibacterota bacterium]
MLIGLLGLLVGSFLNVVILRLNTGRSIVSGRSRCFSCSHILTWRELVPVLSFISSSGKCRNCGTRISLQYPIVELATGFLFALSAYRFFDDLPIILFASLLGIISCLVVIFVYDIKHKIIPDKLVYIFILLSIFWHYSVFGMFSLYSLDTLAGPLTFAFFALLWLVSSGRWMGFGDAKLGLGMGLLLGSAVVTALMIAFWLGAILGLFMLFIQKGRYTIKSEIPFAPFLIIGMLTVFLFNISFF